MNEKVIAKINEVENEWNSLNLCKARINCLLNNIPKHKNCMVVDSNMVERVLYAKSRNNGEYVLSVSDKNTLIKWHKLLP